jgi:hypothetical protein
MAHVHTVECPLCGRPWTGEFEEPLPDKDVCRDCIKKDEALRKEAKDIHNNPRGQRS